MCSRVAGCSLACGVCIVRSARSESDAKMAQTGLLELIHGLRLEEAQKRYNEQPTGENFARLQECQLTKVQSLHDSV